MTADLISRIRGLCHDEINAGRSSALVVASLELCTAMEHQTGAVERYLDNCRGILEARKPYWPDPPKPDEPKRMHTHFVVEPLAASISGGYPQPWRLTDPGYETCDTVTCPKCGAVYERLRHFDYCPMCDPAGPSRCTGITGGAAT